MLSIILLLGLTYNVGVVSGGTMANIVADKAVGEVDVRFKTIVEAESLLPMCSGL